MSRAEHFQLGAGQLEGSKATCAGCGRKIEIMGGGWTDPETGTWACEKRKTLPNSRGYRSGNSMPQPHEPAPSSTKAFQLR